MPVQIVYHEGFTGLGHAACAMLCEAGIEFEWTMAPADGMSFRGNCDGDCFTVPMIIDGDTRVSQSQACVQYVGRKYGFADNVDPDKALQYMLDMSDMWTEFGKAMVDAESLKKFLQAEPCGDRLSGRFGMWMGNIERSIRGKFYFGEKPSYVDFQMLQTVGLLKGRALDKLESKTGCLLDSYPKVKAVYEAISSLPSAAKIPFQEALPAAYLITDDMIAAY